LIDAVKVNYPSQYDSTTVSHHMVTALACTVSCFSYLPGVVISSQPKHD